MSDPAKPTVATLAKEIEQIRQAVDANPDVPAALLAAEAKDAAGMAIDITGALGKDIAALKREQQALAQLVNGLGRQPGDAVKPGNLDNILARLESVEKAGRQDWSPLFEAHSERQGKLAVAVTALADQLATMEDKAGVQPGGPFEDLTRDVEELKREGTSLRGLVAQSGADWSERLQSVAQGLGETRKDFDQLQAAVARLEHGPGVEPGEISALITDEVNERIQRIVRNRASFEQDLLARVRNLEDSGLPGGLSSTVTHVPAVGNVHAKLLELMREVDHIAKTKTAKGGGMNYKFRGIDDAQNAVGQAMRKIGLLLRPEVIDWQYTQVPVEGFDDKGRPKTTVWSTSRLTMGYMFVSPDDGSTFMFSMVGEGRDAGDKSGSKAASMACKYALFQALMVPLEVDESDGDNPVIEREHPGTPGTPGARVSRGEITPAQAVQEYTAPEVSNPTGYNPAMDSSAMAGADTDDTLMQKAAQAAHYLKQAQAQPAEVALPAIKKLMDRVEAYGIGDMKVSWSDGNAPIALSVMIKTALQSVNAAIAQRAQAAGAQGVTRQGQQSGEGVRAAVGQQSGDVSKVSYNAALQVVKNSDATDAEIDDAMAVIHAWESTH